MLIKNTFPRMRFFDNIGIGPMETKEIGDHWKKSIKDELASGELVLVTPEPVAVPVAVVAEAVEMTETEATDDTAEDAAKPKRGRPAKVVE